MKINKTFFINVFLISFLIGATAFYIIPKSKENVRPVENFQVASSDLPVKKIETKFESEILGENNDWKNEYEPKFTAKLLETGEIFHGDEIEAKSGENWLGLFKENNKYFLRSTKINIARVHDPIIDKPKEKTGKSVSVSGKSQPLFLVKNAKKLSEGKVNGSFWMNINDLAEDEYSDASSLNRKFVQEYNLEGTKYILRVKSGIDKKGENIIALVLEGAGKTQVIHSIKSFEEGDYLGGVYFVGDLDRDNKPDFYFDLYIHDNVENKNLYLSSQAKKGELVGKVATFMTTGC